MRDFRGAEGFAAAKGAGSMTMTTFPTTTSEGKSLDCTMSGLVEAHKIPLRFRRRGGVITLVDGEGRGAWEPIRFARVTKQWWIRGGGPAEVKQGSRWEPLPMQAPLGEVLSFVKDNFPWYLGFSP